VEENDQTTTQLGEPIRRSMYVRFACGHWRRDDAESTSLVLDVSSSRADVRSRKVCKWPSCASHDGRCDHRMGIALVLWNQSLSDEGGWSARQKTK